MSILPRIIVSFASAVGLLLFCCIDQSFAQSGSRYWTGNDSTDFYDGNNWNASGDFPNGLVYFNDSYLTGSAYTTVDRTSNAYTYIYSIYFQNTSSAQNAYTVNGSSNIFLGGPTVQTSAVSSGTLTDVINANFQQAGTAEVFDMGSNHHLILNGDIIGSSGAISKNGTGNLKVTGNRSSTGGWTLNAGTLQITNANAITSGGVTSTGTAKLWLDASGGNMTVEGPITLKGGGGGHLTIGSGNVTTNGSITLTGSIDVRGEGSNTHYVEGGITSANNSNYGANNRTIINSVVSLGSGQLSFTSAESEINVTGGDWGWTRLNFSGNLKLGVDNALPSDLQIALGWSTAGQSTATLNLNGTNQTIKSIGASGNLGGFGNWAGQNQNITGGGSLTINQTAAVTHAYGGRITDGATATSIIKNGSAEFKIQNYSNWDSTYSGATTINAGTLTALSGNSSSLSASSAYTVASGAVLAVYDNTESIGSLAGAGTVRNGGSSASSLTIGADNTSTTFSGVIQNGGAGALAITKSGSGTLTLSGENTYSGATTVNAGTLAISGNMSSSALTLNSGGTISAGTTAAADSFGTSSITINGGGYNWTMNTANGSAGTDYDQITSSGALTSSGVLTVYAYGTPGDWNGANTYNWDIISANSVTGFNAGNFTLDLSNFGIAAGNRTGVWSFSNPSGGTIRLTYTAPAGAVTWNSGTGNWSTGAQWVGNTTPVDTSSLTFSGVGGTATNDIASGTLSIITGITFDSGAGAYTLAANSGSSGYNAAAALTTGDITNNSSNAQTINLALNLANTKTVNTASGNITISGVVSGAGGLTKSGSHTLTLSSAANNTYTGTTTVNAGTLVLQPTAAFNGSTWSVASDSTINSGATLKLDTSAQTSSSSRQDVGTITVNSGGTLEIYNTTTTVDASIWSGGAVLGSGTISKTGAGYQGIAWSGSGSSLNNFNGTILVNAGTLGVNNSGTAGNGVANATVASGARIDARTGTLTINKLEGSGDVYTSSSGGVSVGNSNGTSTFNGTLSSSVSLTKNGSGTFTLTGNNTSTGALTVNSGTLAVASTGRLGGGTFTGSLAINGTGAFQWDGSNAQTLSGAISGSGSGGLLVTGSGNLTVSLGSLSFSGPAVIDGGTMKFQNTADLKGVSINNVTIKNGGKLILYSNVGGNNRDVWNNKTLTFDTGGGTFEISNGNHLMQGPGITHNFNTTVAGSGSQITGSGGGFINGQGGGVMTFDIADGASNWDLEFSGGWSNALLVKNGAGTLAINSNLSGSYNHTINAGTLEIGASGHLNAGSYTSAIANNGTLIYSGVNAQTLSGVISGTGALTHNATSTLTLSGSNTYSGGTTLNAGTLVIGNAAAAGTGTITQTDGTSVLKLDATGTIANAMSIYNVVSNQTVTLSGAITAQNTTYDVASGTTLSLNGTISGSGGITKNGTGTLEVNGASNTYTGDTVINAGTLEANASGALGATGNITVHNGGSILVQASNAINDSAGVELAGGTWGFNGNISDTVGALTLSANSTIDMSGGNISLSFASLASALTSSTRLNVYNYTLYSDHIYFTSNANLSSSLQYISFYSDFGSSFIGNSFISSFSSPWQVRPVPEPETWATAALLLIGGGIWMWRKKLRSKQSPQT